MTDFCSLNKDFYASSRSIFPEAEKYTYKPAARWRNRASSAMRFVQGKGTFKALQFDTGCLPTAGRRIFQPAHCFLKDPPSHHAPHPPKKWQHHPNKKRLDFYTKSSLLLDFRRGAQCVSPVFRRARSKTEVSRSAAEQFVVIFRAIIDR